MNKSLFRHLLTSLGTIAMMTGLSKIVPIVNFTGENLDAVWAAVSTVLGFGTALFGFFKNPERLNK